MIEENINKNELLQKLINIQMSELAGKVSYNKDYIQKIYQEPVLFVSKRMFSQEEEVTLELKVTYKKDVAEREKGGMND
jgi:hypothetical protein